MDSRTVDELENDGWLGVYDPNLNMPAGHVWVNVAPDKNTCEDLLRKPASDLDDRIKEAQRASQKPANYRARWNGTKYIYDPAR